MENKRVTLKVLEARPRDVGRGIARVPRAVMNTLGIEPGDAIDLKGTNRTVALCWPGYPDDEGSDAMRIDGIIRRNAGIGIDDRVTIQKVEVKPAKKVALAPTENLKIMGGEEYLSRILEGRVLSRSDYLELNLMGRKIDLIVTKHSPGGVGVLVTDQTRIQLADKPVEEGTGIPHITYEDIGGLNEEIKRVREMIELPMKHPELFERLGIEAPNGLLLHGPPGTGKTLLAKAVASETSAHFTSLSGPEVMSKFYGESEENIRELFQEAMENAPSIIFIDEIDSIAPKRDDVSGEVERRIVAQLLALMDGLEARGQVVVIGATNRPNALDPALRRPGRFDREIEIGMPDRDARLEILYVHTRGMPLADDVSLEHLAQITHGYAGADIQALCKEAGINAMRRSLPILDLEAERIPAELLNRLEVENSDFYDAFRELEPSALREVLIESPNVHWTDVGGLEDAKSELQEVVEWPLHYPTLFEHMHTPTPTGILLYGPPGTGKTLLAKAVASEAEANFISVKGPEFLSKWVGESEKAVRETFRKARQAAPCVVFIDELDSIAPHRGKSSDSHVTERVISQLLTEMDGLEKLHDVIVIAATNRLDMIDQALLRPGRFDRIIYIGIPSAGERREIFAIHTRDKPLMPSVEIDDLVAQTDSMSGADIAAICAEASMMAIREYILAGGTDESCDVESCSIFPKHFHTAIERLRRREKEKREHARFIARD